MLRQLDHIFIFDFRSIVIGWSLIWDEFLLLWLSSVKDFNGNSVLVLTWLYLIFVCRLANDAHLRLVNDIKLSFNLHSSRVSFLHSSFTDDFELLSVVNRLSDFRHIILFLISFDFELASMLASNFFPLVISIFGKMNTSVDFVALSAVMVHVASHSESFSASCTIPAL